MFSELPQIADIVVPVGSRESVETALPDLSRAMDLDPSSHMELGHAQIRDKTITLNCANYRQSAGQPLRPTPFIRQCGTLIEYTPRIGSGPLRIIPRVLF